VEECAVAGEVLDALADESSPLADCAAGVVDVRGESTKRGEAVVHDLEREVIGRRDAGGEQGQAGEVKGTVYHDGARQPEDNM
jgi:hypothetical protein